MNAKEKSLSSSFGNKLPGKSSKAGDFPPCTSNDFYTNWFREDGCPAVQYQHTSGVWAKVVGRTDHGIESFDVSWSGQPGEVRTIYDLAEAVAFAKWLAKP